MKKLLVALLCVCMLLSLFACGSDGKQKKPKQPPAVITAYATHSYDKVIANMNPKGELVNEYTVYMTKGETESCQLVVRSDTMFKKTVFGMDEGENSNVAVSIYSMDRTHTIRRKEWTDSVIPYSGRRLILEANKSLPFVIDFTTTADTPAGEYKYVFSLKNEEDLSVIASFNVTVHVWNITLPETKTFASSVGINKNNIGSFWGGCGTDLYKQFCDMLLEHNLSPHTLPYDILDPRADEYMSDPRVTSFVVPSTPDNLSDEQIIAYYNKIKSNPDWLRKAIFYPIDEPSTKADLEKYKEICERLKRIAPDIPVISPFYKNIQTGTKTDQVDYMDSCTDLWCPKLCLWDDSQSYDPFLNYTPEKSFAERMAEMKAEGDRMWSYVCNDPILPYAQLFINTDGIIHRLMMWQHYQMDIDGFLYWGSTAWGYHGGVRNPWETSANGVKDGNGGTVFGEGILFYPGIKVGIAGPVGCIRMKILRDGIDDIEFLYLAEEVLGKEWVMNYVNKATPTLTSYTTNDDFAKMRIEMGNALEAALIEK